MTEDAPNPLPDGEYAILEMLGHRTIVGRMSEVERFGTKFLSIEPVFQSALLPAVLVGGASIYQLTACSAEVALKRQPRQDYSLPDAVRASLPEPALEFRPAFLDGEIVPVSDGFAKVGEVDVGTELIADGRFACISDGAVLAVESDGNGLWVPCADGRHHLDGQLDEGDEYVGFRLVDLDAEMPF